MDETKIYITKHTINTFSFLHKPNNPFITFYVQYSRENNVSHENLNTMRMGIIRYKAVAELNIRLVGNQDRIYKNVHRILEP